MAGHNKWSKIKHQKKHTDAAKGKAFTKASKGIVLAVIDGGGMTDPDKNVKLRYALEQAKRVNMPKENIQRAIDKAVGKDKAQVSRVAYEAYGPGNVAIIIEGATDNKNRAVAQVKSILDRGGGRLVQNGAVSYLFTICGIITVNKRTDASFDNIMELAIDSGAEDVEKTQENTYVLVTHQNTLHEVVERISESALVTIVSYELTHRANTTIDVSGKDRALLMGLLKSIEEIEDVQSVYTNMKG